MLSPNFNLHFLSLTSLLFAKSHSSSPKSPQNLTSYIPAANLPALQIEHLPSPSALEPNLSISEVYLHIYCPPSTPNALNPATKAQEKQKQKQAQKACLALRGEVCPGAQTVVYYHLWSTGDDNTDRKEGEEGEREEEGKEESKEQQIRIEELPGHEGVLDEAAGGRVVLLAMGQVEGVPRGVGELAVHDRKREKGRERLGERLGRDGFFLGKIALGGDGRVPTLFRSLYQRQVRRVEIKNQRMRRRVRMVGRGMGRLCRWMKGVEEEGRRVWQEGRKVWQEGRRAWREGRMWEMVAKYRALQIGLYFLLQTVCVQVVSRVFLKSAEALGRWSRMKGWIGIVGKVVSSSVFLLSDYGAFALTRKDVRELEGWDGTVWKIATVCFWLLMAFWSVRSMVWGIGPPWTRLSAGKR